MENLNVLITGASSGIGYELLKIFAKKNNNLILVARNRGRLEAIRSELSGQDITVTIIEKDLTQPGAAAAVYEEVVKRNIRVHVLVNNAGIGLYGNFHQLPLQQQMRTIQLNIAALTELTHLFVRDMIVTKFGRILNIGSISSFISTPLMSVYAATKAYVLSFSESLNSELRSKGDISVTALCPGFTKTNFIKEANMGHLEDFVYRIAMSSSVVAQEGYKAVKKGKTIKVAGGLNSFMLILIRLLPRVWLQKLATKVFK